MDEEINESRNEKRNTLYCLVKYVRTTQKLEEKVNRAYYSGLPNRKQKNKQYLLLLTKIKIVYIIDIL